MACRECTSENQSRFPTEIAIHLPGLTTPHVFVFPKILVCMNCGFTEFAMPETELRRLPVQTEIPASAQVRHVERKTP